MVAAGRADQELSRAEFFGVLKACFPTINDGIAANLFGSFDGSVSVCCRVPHATPHATTKATYAT